MTTLLPAASTAAISSWSARTEEASRFAVGSSRTSTSGCATSTDANTRLCFSPPLIVLTSRPTRRCAPSASTVSSMRRSISSTGTPRVSSPKASSSLDVRQKNWLFGFWNTLPTCSASSYISHAEGSRPQTRTCPSSSIPDSKEGMSPLMHFVTVVLPDPDLPMIRTHSPRRTSRSMPSRMRLPEAVVQPTPESDTTVSRSFPRLMRSLRTRRPRPRRAPRSRAPPSRRRASRGARCRSKARGSRCRGTSRRGRARRRSMWRTSRAARRSTPPCCRRGWSAGDMASLMCAASSLSVGK